MEEKKARHQFPPWVTPVLVAIVGFMVKYEFGRMQARLDQIPILDKSLATTEEARKALSMRVDILADEVRRLEQDFKYYIRQPAKHENGEVKPSSN